jgi:uncharacterized protein YyaL (SSP411 family)
MTSPEGGSYATQDADSKGEEGTFPADVGRLLRLAKSRRCLSNITVDRDRWTNQENRTTVQVPSLYLWLV